jgi:hypothetical protein
MARMGTRIESPAKRRQRERQGRRAENVAALWLQAKGYSILARRARTPGSSLYFACRSAPAARSSQYWEVFHRLTALRIPLSIRSASFRARRAE